MRYFTNDFDTKTEGVDVVLTYGWETDLGNTDLLASFNHTTTKVTNFRTGSTIADGDTIDNLERGAPETRLNLTLTHSVNNWYLLGRYSYFGDWYDDHSAAEFDGYGLVDLLAQYNFASGLAVSVGGGKRARRIPGRGHQRRQRAQVSALLSGRLQRCLGLRQDQLRDVADLRPTSTVLGVWRHTHSASNPASPIA